MSIQQPSTFLDLVQRACLECGLSSYPSTVANQMGQALNFVNWTNQAWLDIQNKYTDWSWMLVSPGVAFATVAGQNFYTPAQAGVTAGAVAQWKRETFRNYQTSVGQGSEMFMDYLEYDDWRDVYLFGAIRTAQVRPTVVSVRPTDFAIAIQTPLAGYTIEGDYFAAPVQLTNDSDAPTIPRQYIMAIVYGVMMKYGAFESAPDTYNNGKDLYNKTMTKLEKTRLKEVTGSGPLA